MKPFIEFIQEETVSGDIATLGSGSPTDTSDNELRRLVSQCMRTNKIWDVSLFMKKFSIPSELINRVSKLRQEMENIKV